MGLFHSYKPLLGQGNNQGDGQATCEKSPNTTCMTRDYYLKHVRNSHSSVANGNKANKTNKPKTGNSI